MKCGGNKMMHGMKKKKPIKKVSKKKTAKKAVKKTYKR
jgi:hypothetical protein